MTTLSRVLPAGRTHGGSTAPLRARRRMLQGMLEQAQDEIRDTAAKMLKSGDLKDQKAADKWAARQFREHLQRHRRHGDRSVHVSNKVRSLNSAAVVYRAPAARWRCSAASWIRWGSSPARARCGRAAHVY